MNKKYFSARSLENINKVKISTLKSTKLKITNLTKLNFSIKRDFRLYYTYCSNFRKIKIQILVVKTVYLAYDYNFAQCKTLKFKLFLSCKQTLEASCKHKLS